jgi:hypothetical protein
VGHAQRVEQRHVRVLAALVGVGGAGQGRRRLARRGWALRARARHARVGSRHATARTRALMGSASSLASSSISPQLRAGTAGGRAEMSTWQRAGAALRGTHSMAPRRACIWFSTDSPHTDTVDERATFLPRHRITGTGKRPAPGFCYGAALRGQRGHGGDGGHGAPCARENCARLKSALTEAPSLTLAGAFCVAPAVTELARRRRWSRPLARADLAIRTAPLALEDDDLTWI